MSLEPDSSAPGAASFNPEDHSHRRQNPLTGDWTLVAPHRGKRPWQGQTEPVTVQRLPEYEADCYLCPGNERASGHRNPEYTATYVFENDFSALQQHVPVFEVEDPLFRLSSEQGVCRVVCYSPTHNLTLAEMSHAQIRGVVDCWVEQYTELGQRLPWVQVFENKGAVMGCSMPHPHGQVWATQHAPTLLQKEMTQQVDYFAAYKQSLLLHYAQRELETGERVVDSNADWVVVVPFWAAWPFETLVLPRAPLSRMVEATTGQLASLAEILKSLTVRYDNLFRTAFPYSMGWHGAPMDGRVHPEWQLHAHFFPPLLRSATVRKFMVGYEMLADAQRDLTAEQAAVLLRECSLEHYSLVSDS